MRSLSILHTEWSTGWGGQEIRILTECQEALADGQRVLLAARPGAVILDRARAMEIPCLELPFRGSLDLGSALALRGLIKSHQVDILHTHSSTDSWVGVWADMLSPAVLVRTRHTGIPKVHPFNLVYTRPKAFITTGLTTRDGLIKGYNLDPQRVVSIPTGIDPERFAPRPPDADLAAQLGIEPGAPVVGIVAVLRSWKRHDLFCRMAKLLHERMPEARFLIVGDGPYAETVRGHVRELGVKDYVILTGHREDVERVLSLCQVTVLTSEGQEGTSQSLIQALACQKGVVSANQGSPGDVIIPERTGLLVPFGDVPALAGAVERLLTEPDLRQNLGRAGRELVLQNFTRQVMHRRIMEIYYRVLGISA